MMAFSDNLDGLVHRVREQRIKDDDLDRLTTPITEPEIASLQEVCRDHLSVHGMAQFRRIAFQRQAAIEENERLRSDLEAAEQRLADVRERLRALESHLAQGVANFDDYDRDENGELESFEEAEMCGELESLLSSVRAALAAADGKDGGA